MEQIQLTPEETAILKPFCDHCDARAQGYAEGIEAAKRALIQHFISQRQGKPNDPSAAPTPAAQ